MKTIAALLPVIAGREVGVEEVDGTNKGKRVDEFKAATNLPPHESWAWCAAFVCWCVAQAMAELQAQGAKFTFQRPKTAGAWDFENWSLAQDDSTQTKKPAGEDIAAGDIVIFKFSHIGIATSAPDAEGFILSVEGNTDTAGSREGGGVFRKRRHVSKIRSRIRFTV